MLIDHYMPEWDVREQHQVRVHAPAERVYRALRTADLGGHPLTRALLWVRALPAALGDGRAGLRELRRRAGRPVTLEAFEKQGFRVLEESPPREIVIGLEGAFWKPNGDLRAVDPETFRQPVPPGLARAVWNFAVAPEAPGVCRLSTETRVRVSPEAKSRFRLYWLLVRPGSGLIRRLMLRRVQQRSGQAAA